MKAILYPLKKDWNVLTQRPVAEKQVLSELVNEVFERIQSDGDRAVKEYSARFDRFLPETLRISLETIKKASDSVPEELKSAIILAKENIEKFHASQLEKRMVTETSPGVKCWRENRAIERVGFYIPGGSAPLFSTVLMLGIPAKLAGCKEIILCTPPDQNGEIAPAILYAAQLVGVTAVFRVGGIQAIGAMTFGTESIPKVDKLFGPGNQFVTAAKQAAQSFGVAIDLPAGPSEVLVIADKSCDPSFVAADLLSQAEHGADSQVILLTPEEFVAEAVIRELNSQLVVLPRKEIASEALKNSKVIVLNTLYDCLNFSNLYAPEHLILALKNAADCITQINNAGSVFLGNYSCESAGDYASGTNHTLPTNGYARNYSGVSADSFVKKITFQEVSAEGIRNIGPAIELMAEAEQLFAHKNAVTVRLKQLDNA